jgi:hypothetical protein
MIQKNPSQRSIKKTHRLEKILASHISDTWHISGIYNFYNLKIKIQETQFKMKESVLNKQFAKKIYKSLISKWKSAGYH